MIATPITTALMRRAAPAILERLAPGLRLVSRQHHQELVECSKCHVYSVDLTCGNCGVARA
jgi:hypothetical protein